MGRVEIMQNIVNNFLACDLLEISLGPHCLGAKVWRIGVLEEYRLHMVMLLEGLDEPKVNRIEFLCELEHFSSSIFFSKC